MIKDTEEQTIEIYFEDLTKEAQEQLVKFLEEENRVPLYDGCLVTMIPWDDFDLAEDEI